MGKTKRAGRYMWTYYEGEPKKKIEDYYSKVGFTNPLAPQPKKSKKILCQYNLQGELINTYPSLKEASEITKITSSQLSQAHSGKRKTVGGYMWRFTKTIEEKIEPIIDYKGVKKVKQLDINGELIKIWDSVSDAWRALGINRSHIAEVCRGGRDTAGGFIWEYIE